MSNIYIQEPPTSGKVLMKTTAGDIDIELWSKEAPKACRNFVQLCMEGYYDGTIFHRVVQDFIIQGGDPSGTGLGGESIYGRPFKDEFHSRLRFIRRGLVAMANAGAHDNGSQFFFTLGRADELNNKHTIFGKVTGDTIYNLLRLAEVECDVNERPLNPHKIRTTEVLHSPFDDIVPRETKKGKKDKEEVKKSQSKATKNFSLLSFGEEAEEEEEMVNQVSQFQFQQHDELRKEVRQLKKELQAIKQRKEDKPAADEVKEAEKKPTNEAVAEYLEGRKKYEELRKTKLKKGSNREEQTMALLNNFKSKLSSAITENPEGDVEELAEDEDTGWMAHVLQFDEQTRKVKDANMQDEDTFEIYDPRNPVNKRRREESKKLMKEKKVKK
ncbi:spliceosome-associated protein CWC27 homolog [Austrofundulus limnaeus]|uniref:Spliceosome-associated protein CWC27 homolog n=1 Tax=Austrofundulus limnaeus TaxID=52670 RepID=A0A2I4CHD1_AUSLI|nr:PREDICTED: peptidyl-prolyl cis-trans isomerase CWC27 homolog [Austrofundulus limnaeus]